MSLNPAATILKVFGYAILVTILVVMLYGYLSSMAITTGVKQVKKTIELVEEDNRKQSW